jgi:hypothetical protein
VAPDISTRGSRAATDSRGADATATSPDLESYRKSCSQSCELRVRELRGELEGLVETRSGHERALQALDKQIESKRRTLELVEATPEAAGGPRRRVA